MPEVDEENQTKRNAETQRTHSECEREVARRRRRKRSPFEEFLFPNFRLSTVDCELFAGEALEVGHLALHFFASGVGGGADTLDAQLEFVGVGGAREGFV